MIRPRNRLPIAFMAVSFVVPTCSGIASDVGFPRINMTEAWERAAPKTAHRTTKCANRPYPQYSADYPILNKVLKSLAAEEQFKLPESSQNKINVAAVSTYVAEKKFLDLSGLSDRYKELSKEVNNLSSFWDIPTSGNSDATHPITSSGGQLTIDWSKFSNVRNEVALHAAETNNRFQYFKLNETNDYYAKLVSTPALWPEKALKPVGVFPFGYGNAPTVMYETKVKEDGLFPAAAPRQLDPCENIEFGVNFTLVPEITQPIGIETKIKFQLIPNIADNQMVVGNPTAPIPSASGANSVAVAATQGDGRLILPRPTTQETENIHDISVGVEEPTDQEACKIGSSSDSCYMPAVALTNGNRLICSGTLVAAQWVLTSSHCMCRNDISAVVIGQSIPDSYQTNQQYKKLELLGGKIDYDGDFCTRFNATLSGSEAFNKPDLSLLKLKYPLDANIAERLHAVIATPELLDSINHVEVVGFGKSRTDAYGGRKLLGRIDIASRSCSVERVNGKTITKVDCIHGKEMIVSDLSKMRDSCNGDSGAGAFARLKNGQIALVGVVSRGINERCGDGGIYVLTTTPDIRKWLTEKTERSVRLMPPSRFELAQDFNLTITK